MSELLKEMGQRILERRKQLNMTQETLANLTHLTSQTISYAEMGQKAMRPETMLKICEALGISADYLLRGKILEADTSLLQQKISTLTPSQYRHLEQIIDHFIAAIFVADKQFLENTDRNNAEKRSYSVSEAAEILGVSKRSIYNLCASGAFKSVRIGTKLRISRKSFDEWLDGSD